MDASRRGFIRGAGALACGLLGACSTPPESAPPEGVSALPPPNVREGQYWEYAVRDAYTGLPRGLVRHTLAVSEPDRVVVDVTRDGQRIDTYIYAGGWNPIEQPLTNLQRFRYDPPFPAYDFPLYAGKAWRRVVRATDAVTGRSYNVHVHASVGGLRRIRVPAGEYEALQVRRYVYAGNAEFFRLQEEIVQNDWYAPAIGNAIVSEGSSSHIDTSRSGGGRGRPLRVRGDWLIEELVGHSA